jgi:hypothetical protein
MIIIKIIIFKKQIQEKVLIKYKNKINQQILINLNLQQYIKNRKSKA